MQLDIYKTLIFDCDGVVLNSNEIKTKAFYDVTKHFGQDAAQAFVDYHLSNGGISRYAKFKYFFNHILNQAVQEDVFNKTLQLFAKNVKRHLLKCEIAKGLDQLRARTKLANWMIVSGGDQAELRNIFSIRKLDMYFDGGIFGSPDNKAQILKREVANGNISSPALFIGDSKYDFMVAKTIGLDFIFVTDWSDVENIKDFVHKENIRTFESISKIK